MKGDQDYIRSMGSRGSLSLSRAGQTGQLSQICKQASMHSGFLQYQIDEKQEKLKRRLYKQKLVNKRFKDQEYITDLYKKNLDLHRKLDIIQRNGTGIANR